MHGLGRAPSDWAAAAGQLAALGPVHIPSLPADPAAALRHLDGQVLPGSIVVGHSMGAVLAMRLVAHHPRPLTAAVLSGCFFPPARNGRSTRETLTDYVAHRVAFVRGSRTERLASANRGAIRPLVSLVRQALMPRDVEAALDRWTAAVLVVHARDDHHVPIDFAIAAANRHPTWNLAILEHGGHHAHLTESTAWLHAVIPWLAARLAGPLSTQ